MPRASRAMTRSSGSRRSPLETAMYHVIHPGRARPREGSAMTRIRLGSVALAFCLGAVGCTTYNPTTGQYETDPYGTSLLAGGLGMAGGVALGAALSDHDDCCWGGGWGGWGGGDVDIHNNYNRNVNYNKNVNRNRANYNRSNYNRGGRGTYGGGGRGGGGWGGGGRG